MLLKLLLISLFASLLGFPQSPQVVSLTPLNGTRTSATFSITVSDPNGVTDLSSVRFLINSSPDPLRGCHVGHVVGTNTLWLRDDNNETWQGSTEFGTAVTVSNSQCSITGTGASASTSGNNYTLTLPVTFKPQFAGLQYTYVRVWDEENKGPYDWIQQGHWIVPDLDTAAISGLNNQLQARPVRGPAFVGGRAAVIAAAGELNAASGNPGDCVRVDGTSGPCAGAPKVDRFDFRTQAVTQTLTLSGDPVGEVQVYRNGLLQFPGMDYDRSANAVTFRTASPLGVSDLVQVVYSALPAVTLTLGSKP